MMDALRLEKVSRHYAGRAVLKDLDLSLPAGACIGVHGRNGAGKTTLLRLAATLIHPTAGRVLVGGHDTRRASVAARHHLAYVAQDAPVYDELTPAEHIAWWNRLRGHDTDVRSALEQAGLARVADARCRTLSRGQRQRTALATALATDAPLLLLDEPFAALDTDGAAWLEAAISARRGATLLVDHDSARLGRLCQQTLALEAP